METVKDLNSILECLLFTAGRPLTAKDFAKVLEIPETEIKKTLDTMVEEKMANGIVLLNSGDEYQLATSSKYSTEVKNFLNAELREKLTDATVEVLAIIAYRQPISKAEIEAIRGVNSQYSLRNLLMRGLIEKVTNPSDARSFLYQTTTEFLMHMGITSAKELPEFEKLVAQIKLPQTAALDNQARDNTQKEQAEVTPETSMDNEKVIEEINQPTIEAPIVEPAVEPETSAEAKPETEDEDPEDDEDEEDDDEDDK